MVGEGIADLLEAPPIDLRARGFRRVTRARRAWDKRISDDIVWRISIDDDRASSIYAGVVVPFFAACRPYAVRVPPYRDWRGVVNYDASTPLGRGLLAEPRFDLDHPRRRLRPWVPQTAPEQLTWLINEHAMPYLERFTDLPPVIDEVLRVSEERARELKRNTWGHVTLCQTALMRWRLGDLAGAESDLVSAASLIVRTVYRTTTIWPPSGWFRHDPADGALDEKLADEGFAEDTAFVRDVSSFIRTHDPTGPLTAVPLWPGVDDVARTWRAGRWRKQWLRPPWKEPTLLVQAHDEDVVGILYGPVGTGSGEAWLGPGPAYFDDDATYDVDSAAAGLATWAEQATGTRPDPLALRELISPSSTVDLVEALTELCRLLGLKLPRT